ncbi:S1 family peptidase [Mucilaginibacter psychrotolerans]|uniref:Serine protease n=1 Tax=Mucilaginibacter psychrotolerans TaxID=1524096 RepID=A0A4Y8SCJ5_9SPHI|nr:serine protease [Mucilaginibacter psychrotolerans]TFF36317.1 serine protease [Mucilaginibacter psychrotolerans]
MKINRILTSLLLVTLLNCCIVKAQDYNSAIVRIYTTKINRATGKSNSFIGTGFFVKINNNIYISTAYHLIVSSRIIDAHCVRGQLSNITVAAYNEEKDIALLNFEVPTNRLPINPLIVLSVLPKQLSSLKGVLIGNPMGIERYKVEVDFNKDELVPSKNYKILSADVSLNLLPATATVYNGMSGGPLILNGKVIGFLSGSFNQGGSILVVVPVSYLINDQKISGQLKQGLQLILRNGSELPPLKLYRPGSDYNELVRNEEAENVPPVIYDQFHTAALGFQSDNLEFARLLRERIQLFSVYRNAIKRAPDVADFIQQSIRYNFLQRINDSLLLKAVALMKENSNATSALFSKISNENKDNKVYKEYVVREAVPILFRLDSISQAITVIDQSVAANSQKNFEVERALKKFAGNNDFLRTRETRGEWLNLNIEWCRLTLEKLRSLNLLFDSELLLKDLMVESLVYTDK